jgi:hypothetical protein
VVYTHRWLGIALSLPFVVWFASGVVMMYARMPELDPRERLARLPGINGAAIRTAPPAGPNTTRLTVAMLGGRPVYRLLEGRRWRTVFADTGEDVGAVTERGAVDIAARFAPGAQAAIRYLARLTDADQWAFGVRALVPLHCIALGDADDTRVYVSDQTADVVLVTTRSSRRWGWFGAVLHWMYFTPLRRQSVLWSQTIIWLSLAGTTTAALGLAWGVWRYSPSRRYRLKRQASRSPYAGLMKWHHYTGLVFGATTVTWVFSGLLSMDPWNWHPTTSPTGAQRDAFSGGEPGFEAVDPARLARAVETFGSPAPKEVEVLRVFGKLWLRADAGLVSLAHPASGVQSAFERDAMLEAARRAMPGVAIEDATWLDAYDAYYYDRRARLSLPVLRVRYGDPARTWLYVDPSRGGVVRKEERLTRLNRWLYHGLHSLDFPFLYYRRPLWDSVVILLSVGGILLSVTTMTKAWRRLKRHARARRRTAGF